MKKSYVFLADGFEEIEAIGTVDILLRSGMDVETVSINPTDTVTSVHGIAVKADRTIDTLATDCDADWLICPGGMPGASNLAACKPLGVMLTRHFRNGGRIAAICAAPAVVLEPLGILKGRKATCYPGMETLVNDAEMTGEPVVALDTLITGYGPGAVFKFGLAIVAATKGQKTASDLAAAMMVK